MFGSGKFQKGCGADCDLQVRCSNMLRNHLRILIEFVVRLSSEAGRSASPYVASDAGNMSDESKTAAARLKATKSSKAKRQGQWSRFCAPLMTDFFPDEAEFSLNRKRVRKKVQNAVIMVLKDRLRAEWFPLSISGKEVQEAKDSREW